MEALRKKVKDAETKLKAAEAELESRKYHPPPVKHDAESKVRTAQARFDEALNELNAGTESQPQLIERRKRELANAEAVLAKARANTPAYDEAEKNVAIAEYRLAQDSKPAPAAGPFGGRSRRRRAKKVKKTQRRKSKILRSV